MSAARRLDADQPSPAGARPSSPVYRRTCLECGAPYEAGRRHSGFCCQAHRKAFNNRRMVRGAEIYDLFMTGRYDRKIAAVLKVWRELARLALRYREEDAEERGGRPSWRSPKLVIARLTDTGRLSRGEILVHGKRRD